MIDPNKTLQDWLVVGLSQEGKDVAGLAKRLKIHPSAIYKLMAGTRDFQLHEIPLTADYLGKKVPKLWD